MNNRGCLGRKMYSDSTLKSCTKDELIKFLHTAEKNYQALSETYETSVANAKEMIIERDKPKKPKVATVSVRVGFCDWVCPTCGKVHLNIERLQYCSSCGQKINWDDFKKYIVDSEDDEEAEEDES